jgi:hypothetical protein
VDEIKTLRTSPRPVTAGIQPNVYLVFCQVYYYLYFWIALCGLQRMRVTKNWMF